MKKKNYLFMLLCICPMVGFGQLKVLPNGKTVIYSQGSSTTGTAQLTINSNTEVGLTVDNNWGTNTNVILLLLILWAMI